MVASHAVCPIPASEVVALHRSQAWSPERTEQQVAAVLGSSPSVGAWDGPRLVGFASAVTDGVLRAYVEDVVVAPDHRGVGVGNALVEGILVALRTVPVVTLLCAAEHVQVYERAGFRATGQVVLHRS